jgi:hypothetical protein
VIHGMVTFAEGRHRNRGQRRRSHYEIIVELKQ